MPTKEQQRSARERLLAAADELFYAEGIHTVGIDRVIERAGVAKASLYSTFGSKDELVRAYLAGRHDGRKVRIEEALAQHRTPRSKLLGLFDLAAETVSSPTYRGCAFVNASAESQPESAAAQETARYRAWVRSVFLGLVVDLGAPDPAGLTDQLLVLYDGVIVGARLDQAPARAAAARAAAEVLIDVATR